MDGQRRSGARAAIFAQLVEAGRAEQVAKRLTDAIILGVLTAGERLPSEPDLARRFGVALITVREALSILRDAGLVETRRGREGGSFVVAADAAHDSLLRGRLAGLAQVELSDLAVYFGVIAAGAVERAASRATPADAERFHAWCASAEFGATAVARTNAGGFFLELAVLSQSARLVREQIRLQAEFGPLLLIGMADPRVRSRFAESCLLAADAMCRADAAVARSVVSGQVQVLAESLLAAKGRVERGGQDEHASVG